MVEQCRPYLAFDKYTNASLANYLQRMVEHDIIESARKKEDPGMMGKAVNTINETGKWLGSFIFSGEDEKAEKKVRSYCYSATGAPAIRFGSWTLFNAQDSYGRMYKAISGPKTRTPGTCDDRSTEAHTSLSELGRTNEWIHPSVKWRIDTSKDAEKAKEKYESKPLEDFKYDQKNGEYGWQHKTKDVWIPEWPITAATKKADTSTYNDNAEMALIEQCGDHKEVRAFLKKHAEAWKKAHPAAK